MKKLIKRITTTCLTLLIAFLSLITALALEEKSSSATLSFANNSLATFSDGIEQLSVDDTLFLIDPVIARTSGKYVYVYDNADSTIKIIDKETNTYKATNNHYIVNVAVSDILVSNNALFLFSSATNSFSCIDCDTFETLEFNQTSLTTLSSAKFIKNVTIGEEEYMLMCPENPITSDFELAKIDRQENVITVDSVSKFRMHENLQDSLRSYSEVFVDSTSDEKLFLMFITENNNILSFQIDPSSVNSVETSMTAVAGFTSTEDILDVSAVTITGYTKTVAVTINNTIKFFELSIAPAQVSMTEIQDMAVTVPSNFVISDAHGNSSTLALISNTSQQIKIYNFDRQVAPFYYEQDIKNPTISVSLYDNNNFTYLKVIKDTPILTLPYSKEGQITAIEDEEVVVIGEGQDISSNKVYGWYYVLYSKNGLNYYGYIASIDTNEKVETTYNKNYVTVYAYTKLYTYPSKITDSNNKELLSIGEYSRLEVLDSICDYTSLSTKYLKVKVNGEDVGYIDRESIILTSDTSERIIPDATVINDGSEIFSSTAEDRQILDVLNKGKRVKVIGKRDTITNFTLVTYNDAEGNVCTGYIYTYNLEADSWTMLQTIGIFLVVLNVILLIIIICLKNKVTR